MSGCALAFLSRLLCLMPERIGDGFGRALGLLAHALDRKHRERARANLRMVFPDWSDEKVRRVARMVFAHFGKTGARFLRAPALSREQVLASVRCEGLDLIHEALSEGKGAILITAHIGNWERMAHYFALNGIPLSVIARDANDQVSNQVVNRTRRSQGFDVYSRTTAARRVLRDLQQNRCVGILPDQNAQEAFVPFFGKPAGTVLGPAMFHLHANAPILTTFCIERHDGSYEVTVSRLDLPERTGNREADAIAVMARINQAIEQVVREHPEQWLWLHDRWRSARQEGLL
ncbi:MAG: lysophospholipid acyltransferase family protein [Armatimonadota bacterium]